MRRGRFSKHTGGFCRRQQGLVGDHGKRSTKFIGMNGLASQSQNSCARRSCQRLRLSSGRVTCLIPMAVCSRRPSKAMRERHGMTKSPEYQTWANMRSRCSDPDTPAYRHYGGRGITVCEQWCSFTRFFQDMGPRPSPNHSIDRIDNDGNYEPKNCRWATKSEQAHNRRLFRISHNGATHTIPEWSLLTGIPVRTLRGRISRGMSGSALLFQGKFTHYTPRRVKPAHTKSIRGSR